MSIERKPSEYKAIIPTKVVTKLRDAMNHVCGETERAVCSLCADILDSVLPAAIDRPRLVAA